MSVSIGLAVFLLATATFFVGFLIGAFIERIK